MTVRFSLVARNRQPLRISTQLWVKRQLICITQEKAGVTIQATDLSTIERRVGLAYKIAKWKTGVHLLKCKKIFYITVDISSFSAYNKSEKIEGGHHNEV